MPIRRSRTLTVGLVCAAGLALAALASRGPAAARGDTVWLSDGTAIEGRVVEEDARVLVIEVPGGRVRIPRGRVDRVDRAAPSEPAAPTAAAMPASARHDEAPVTPDAPAETGAAARIREAGASARALDRSGRGADAEAAAVSLVAEVRRSLTQDGAVDPEERVRAADAARDEIARLPPALLAPALEAAAGLPLHLLAPAIERALELSRPPPRPGVRAEPGPALTLRRACAEALCHAVSDADAPLDPSALGLIGALLDEPDDAIRLLAIDHLDGCRKPGVPLALVDLLASDSSPVVRARVRGALVRMAGGVDHGEDVALWRAFFRSSR